jgi:hypothetical protein
LKSRAPWRAHALQVGITRAPVVRRSALAHADPAGRRPHCRAGS